MEAHSATQCRNLGIPLRYFTTLLFAVLCVHYGSAAELDAAKLEKWLWQLADDDLGVSQFQKHLDNDVQYRESMLDGKELTELVAASLREKFQERIQVVESLKKLIEEEYANFPASSSFPDCCDADVTELNDGFKTEVNLQEICTAGEETPSATKFITSKIRDAMKENLQIHPTIKWQYFASEEGVISTYPSFHLCQEGYDPRFRPWYVSTATPQPKDVVVVIDKSGSMSTETVNGSSRMEVAKWAASTVINSLSPDDRVGIVSFSNEAETPPGKVQTSACYATMLAKATPLNKAYLDEYLVHLTPELATYYSKAFQKAFELIANAGDDKFDNRSRDKVILFLTDGLPNEAHTIVLETIRDENAKLGNKVVILTYGIGEDALMDEAATLLDNIARQVEFNASAGNIQEGKFTPVENSENLRKVMGSYYSFFSQREHVNLEARFVVPYYDAFGLGLVTSACLPVYHSNSLVGVTCVDLTMSELFSDITYFTEGELSYAFLIDKQARLLRHPLLPQPYTVDEDPIYINMPALENFQGVEEVMESMLREEVGERYITSLRVASRGNAVYEGVKTMNVSSTYYWRPVEGTDFSLCLVISDRDRRTSVPEITTFDRNFIYHRLDLKKPLSATLCNYYELLVVKERTTVQFSPDAFRNSYEYLATTETVTKVDGYEVYMTGFSDQNPGFKDGVRESVTATAYMDDLLTTLGTRPYVVWRYIGTQDGVFRTSPGSSLDKKYDHTQRHWYQRSVSERGHMTFSTPYTDVLGAGYVLTLSKALYKGSTNVPHTEDDQVIGVIAMDFTMSYLYYYTLLEIFPKCNQEPNSCFIVDRSGFLVVHKDFFQTDGSVTSQVENVHISVKEPYIATKLIEQSIMMRKACINFETMMDQYFWTVSVGSEAAVETEDFELHEIPTSNIFLVMKKFSEEKTSDCTCAPASAASNGLGMCRPILCQCPCAENSDIYRYCQDHFDLPPDAWPPCTPRMPEIDLNSESLPAHAGAEQYDQCYTFSCSMVRNQYDCTASASCKWCQMYKDGTELDTPFCELQNNCIDGKLPYNKGTTAASTVTISATTSGGGDGEQTGEGNSGGTDIGAIAGGATAGAVFTLLLVAVVFLVWRHKKSQLKPDLISKSIGVSIWRRGHSQCKSSSATSSSPNGAQRALPSLPSPRQSATPHSTDESVEYGPYSQIDESQVHIESGPYSTIGDMGLEQPSPGAENENGEQPERDHEHAARTPQPPVETLTIEPGLALSSNAFDTQAPGEAQSDEYLKPQRLTSYSNAVDIQTQGRARSDDLRLEQQRASYSNAVNIQPPGGAQSDEYMKPEQHLPTTAPNLHSNSPDSMDQRPTGTEHESAVAEHQRPAEAGYQSLAQCNEYLPLVPFQSDANLNM